MPEVTLTYADENAVPSELKAFKTAENKVTVWVNSSKDAVAAELNPTLEKNRNDILTEKNVLEDKYKALVSTSGKDARETAELIAAAEAKAKNALPEEDKKLLDAVKAAKSDATPDYVKEAITKYPTVNQELTSLKTVAENSKFFTATGFKDEKAFQKAIADKDANPKLIKHYTETKTENNKEVVTAYADIKKDDGTTEKVLFSEYVEKHADWDVYKPSLATATTTQQTQTFLPANQHQQPTTQTTNPSSGLPSNSFLDSVQQGMEAVNKAKTAQPEVPAKTTT